MTNLSHRAPWPSRRRRLLLAASLALCVHPAVAADLPPLPKGLNAPAKPTTMPAFDLPTVAGPNLRSESLKGQVVIVRFWASW